MNIEQLKKTAKEKPQDKTFYYIKFVLNEICTNNNPLHSTDFFHFCFFCLLHVFQSSVLFNSFFATCLCLIYIIRLIFLFLSFFLLLCQLFLHLIGYSWSIPVLCSFSPVFFPLPLQVLLILLIHDKFLILLYQLFISILQLFIFYFFYFSRVFDYLLFFFLYLVKCFLLIQQFFSYFTSPKSPSPPMVFPLCHLLSQALLQSVTFWPAIFEGFQLALQRGSPSPCWVLVLYCLYPEQLFQGFYLFLAGTGLILSL